MAGFDLLTISIVATAVFTGVLLGLAFLPYFRTWRTTYSSRSGQLKIIRAESDEVDSVFTDLANKLGNLRSLAIVFITVFTVIADLVFSLVFAAEGNYAAFIGLASWLPNVLTIVAIGGFLQIARSRLQNSKLDTGRKRRDASFLYTLIFFLAGAWGFFSAVLTIALAGVTYLTFVPPSINGPVWLTFTVLSALGSLTVFSLSAQARVLIEQETFATRETENRKDVFIQLSVNEKGQATPRVHYGKLLGIGPLCVFRREDELIQAVKWSSITSVAAVDVELKSDSCRDVAGSSNLSRSGDV